MPILFAKERAVIVRLAHALARTSTIAYFPGQRIADAIELRMVAGYVLLGHVEDKPMTVSALSRATGLSRATVLRRLEQLKVYGYVRRTGRHYCIAPKANIPNVEAFVRRQTALIKLTAKELANLNT